MKILVIYIELSYILRIHINKLMRGWAVLPDFINKRFNIIDNC